MCIRDRVRIARKIKFIDLVLKKKNDMGQANENIIAHCFGNGTFIVYANKIQYTATVQYSTVASLQFVSRIYYKTVTAEPKY